MKPPTTPIAYFASRQPVYGAEGPVGDWQDMAALIADGGRQIRDQHAALVRRGEPPKAAAKYLVGWIAGGLAAELGRIYASSQAIFVADDSVRYLVHPEGWPVAIDASHCRVLVPDGHPWATLEAVTTAQPSVSLTSVAVEALVAAAEPYLELVHQLAKVGRHALWVEVADGLGLALNSQRADEYASAQLAALRELVSAEGAPWHTRPHAWVSHRGCCDLIVGQKGGCCLAFTRSEAPASTGEADEDELRYRESFSPDPFPVDYCLTCCLRDVEDAERRQVYWAERRRDA
jgi:hypothetical protein